MDKKEYFKKYYQDHKDKMDTRSKSKSYCECCDKYIRTWLIYHDINNQKNIKKNKKKRKLIKRR